MQTITVLFQSILAKLRADKLRAEVTRNMSISLVIKVCSLGAGLILQLVLARLLGVEEFGVYTFVWATFLSISILGKLGFELSSIRFVADYRIQADWASLKGFWLGAQMTVLGVSVCVVVLAMLLVMFWGQMGWGNRHLLTVFKFAIPLLPLYALTELNSGILRGLNRLTESLLTLNVMFPMVLAMLALLSFFFVDGVNATTAVVLSYFAIVSTLAIQYWLIRRLLPRQVFGTRAKFEFAWVKISAAMMISSGLDQFFRQAGVVAAGVFLGTTASGILAVATRFSRLVNVGLQISNQSTAHMLTPLYVQKRDQELQRVVSMTALATMLTTVPIVLVLLVWPGEVLSFFGKAFAAQGVLLLRILLVGQLVNSMSGPNGLLMHMTNYQNEMLRILLVTTAFYVCLLALFIPYSGIAGIALATTLTIFFRNVITSVWVYRFLGVNTTVFSRHIWIG